MVEVDDYKEGCKGSSAKFLSSLLVIAKVYEKNNLQLRYLETYFSQELMILYFTRAE